MFMKEFPALSALAEGECNEIWDTIPGRLYKILEMLHQERIPNSDYSMADLEGLIKSLIFRQTKPGRFIVMGGSWSLIGADEGAPSDVRVELVFFPTYMVVSLMTLFWYRYPERAKRLKGFQEALNEGLNFASMRRLFGHGMEGDAQRMKALRILNMGNVFRYLIENVDKYPKCRPLYNVLIDCKKDVAEQYFRVSKEILSLHKSLAILPNKVSWKTSDHFMWRFRSNSNTDCLVIVEAPYATLPKAEVHTDTIANGIAVSGGTACIIGRYSRKYYRHTTATNNENGFIVSEYRGALREILDDAGALDASGKASLKVLHLIIRGLGDKHGVDVEISTRNSRSCAESIADWVLNSMKAGLERDLRPLKRFIVQKNQLFSGGSRYLELNRNGEVGNEPFAGFGENYNAMEIRISRGTRKSYLDRVIDCIGELVETHCYDWNYKG